MQPPETREAAGLQARRSVTDQTWNPVRGCTPVSEGCRNCYAMAVAARFNGPGMPYEGLAHRDGNGPHWTGNVRFVPEHIDDPLRWKRPRRIFVNSMSDLFHEGLSDDEIAAVFGVMAFAPQHQYQVLTKRPERMRQWFARATLADCEAAALAVGKIETHSPKRRRDRIGTATINGPWPLPQVWLGVSVEDQATADARIPILLDTPAAVRFVSAEPLLGHVDLGLQSATCDCCPRWSSRWIRLTRPVGPDLPHLLGTAAVDHVADAGVYRADSNRHGALSVQTPRGVIGIKPDEFAPLPGLDQVIVGGESGPGARPCRVDWIASIIAQCRAAGAAVFCKQLGREVRWNGVQGGHGDGVPNTWPAGTVIGEETSDGWAVRLRDRKGGDPAEWPESLRVREFPETVERLHSANGRIPSA